MPSLSASSFDLYLRTCSADAEQSDGPEKSRSLDPPRSDAPVRDARGAAAHPAQNFSLREKERPASEPLLMRVVSVEVANGSFRPIPAVRWLGNRPDLMIALGFINRTLVQMCVRVVEWTLRSSVGQNKNSFSV